MMVEDFAWEKLKKNKKTTKSEVLCEIHKSMLLDKGNW